MSQTGAGLVVDALVSAGVRHLFSLSGNQILSVWNAEHQLQIQHYGAGRTVGCQLEPSRYDLVAQALGAHRELVERPEDLEPALARAVTSGLPACVNVAIDGLAAPTYRAAPGAH